MNRKDQEMNDLSYKGALRYDKRSFVQYCVSLMRTKHILIFSLFYTNDYNSRLIKVDLFLISFILYCTVNALFFRNATIHQIYEDKGVFNFIYQLPQIIYSSIISVILNNLLKFLALSQSALIELKKKKKAENINEEGKEVKNKLKKKFIIYFIFSTVLILFLWYYLATFCAVYKNTQIHLISDTLISFGLSLIYPFGIYLLPGLFRIPALRIKNKRKKKNKRNYLFIVSKVLQII